MAKVTLTFDDLPNGKMRIVSSPSHGELDESRRRNKLTEAEFWALDMIEKSHQQMKLLSKAMEPSKLILP